MIITTNSDPIKSIKISWEMLLEIGYQAWDESVLYESPAVYEFSPYTLPGFRLDKGGDRKSVV